MNLPKGKQYGLIAQDLEKVIPNLVQVAYDKSMDQDHPFEYKAINYIGLIPILSQAIKEQQIQIDTKDVTITKLQEQMVLLQSQMINLLNRVNTLDATQQACCTAAQQTKVVANEQPVALTSASLDQNVPNPPVNHATRIGYNVPKGAGKAEMIITDNYGKKLKTNQPVCHGQRHDECGYPWPCTRHLFLHLNSGRQNDRYQTNGSSRAIEW